MIYIRVAKRDSADDTCSLCCSASVIVNMYTHVVAESGLRLICHATR